MENGIIDLSYIQEQVDMNKRKEYLSLHPYTIWQGSDDKWRTYLPDRKKGRTMIKRSSRRDLENEIIEYWKEEVESPTLEQIFYEWLDSRLEYNEISKGTYDKYENDFKRFYLDDRKFGKIRIKDVDEYELEDFIKNSIVKHSLSAKGFAGLRLVTNGMFKRAKKRRYISWSITELLKDMEVSKNSFKKVVKEDKYEVFSDEEMDKVMKYLQENPDMYNLVLTLIFVTGLRIGEAVSLKWDDFDGTGLKIQRTEIKFKGDNGAMTYEIKDFPKTEAGLRVAVIPPNFSWILKRARLMNPFGEFIFEQDGERVMTYNVSHRLKMICKWLGICRKSPHKIRKTYGSILLDNKVDNNLILQQMGHTDIMTTENHYHRNRKSLEVKASIIGELPEFSKNAKVINR